MTQYEDNELHMGKEDTCSCCWCDGPVEEHAGNDIWNDYHSGNDALEFIVEIWHQPDLYDAESEYNTLIRSFKEFGIEEDDIGGSQLVEDYKKDNYKDDYEGLRELLDDTLKFMKSKDIVICMGWRAECEDGTRRCQYE